MMPPAKTLQHGKKASARNRPKQAMKIRRHIQSALRLLTPGIGVKRWLLLLACGIALLILGFGVLLRQFYPLQDFLYYATLQFVPRALRAGLFGLAGTVAVVLALIGLSKALLEPFGGTTAEKVVNTVYQYHQRERGPKVVAIGGGHGLSTLLRGLKRYTPNITAVVTVADDGGSSGQLRRDLGVLPPGDFRNCIAALADDEALTTYLFQYRFPSTTLRTGPPAKIGTGTDGNGLNGHCFGNLFSTAMAEVTGSFERAILESGRVLAIRGRVLPSTLRDVKLMADLQAEPARVSRVAGESSITKAGGAIERVYLEPDDVPAYPETVHVLLGADLIVAGPGSLYTSVLPNLLVPDITRAIAASPATKVYVCNVATQRGETEAYTAGDHVAALEAHVGRGLFPIVLVNNNLSVDLESPGVELVRTDFPSDTACQVIEADLVDPTCPWRHDSDKLALALLRLLQ
jgi:uncharacterized cofD-like protein